MQTTLSSPRRPHLTSRSGAVGCFFGLTLVFFSLATVSAHEVLVQGNGKLARVSAEGNITWEMPWGEQLEVVNNYNQLSVSLEQKMNEGIKLNMSFKVYDDGLGFRYYWSRKLTNFR